MPAKGWRKPEQVVVAALVFAQCAQCPARASLYLIRAGCGHFCESCWRDSIRQARQERRAFRRELAQQKAFEEGVMRVLLEIARRSMLKGKGVVRMPEEYAVRVRKLPDRIAAIVGKTYSEQGDAFELADDEALGMVRDLLIELDAEMINRNKNKKLARLSTSS